MQLIEQQLQSGDLTIFPARLYAQNHCVRSPQEAFYTPKELMLMDWLDECVDGALPSYDELDVKTRVLADINGLAVIKEPPAAQKP